MLKYVDLWDLLSNRLIDNIRIFENLLKNILISIFEFFHINNFKNIFIHNFSNLVKELWFII